MLTIVVVLFLSVFFIGGMRLVQANENVVYDKSFITVEVKDGDTLTSFAQEFSGSAADYSDYINEVKSINNLKSDTIHVGCYLLIPVYEIYQE